MSSLADLPEVIGFFSYSRDDDESYKGRLSALREGIQHELSAQLGRSKTTFRLWQDREAIAPGKLWETEIKTAVGQSVFFIPIVTPRAVNSQYCQFEFESFLERERALGRTDLVFPILYVPVPALENEARWRDHAVLSAIAKRQYVDWRTFRYSDVDTPLVRETIAGFCHIIVKALNEPWLAPEERARRIEAEATERAEKQRHLEEVEARRRAEEEAHRRQHEADAHRRRQEEEAERRAEEETRRQRQEAEAQRRRQEEEAGQRKQDEERRLRAEAEAAAWARLPRPFTVAGLRDFLWEFSSGENAASAKAELESLQRIEQAFDAAKRADTLAALNSFLAEHRDSGLAPKAIDLRDKVAARDEAYDKAIASGDAAALEAFLDGYSSGTQAADVRRRLKAERRTDAYKQAMASGDPVLLKSFLAAHPGDAYAEAVRARLREINPLWRNRRAVLVGGAAVGAMALGVVALRREWITGPQSTSAVANTPPPSSPVTSSALIRTLVGHGGEVSSADFNPDGTRVMTRSFGEKSARLWDTNSGAAIATFSGSEYIYPRFSADGASILVQSGIEMPRLWDGRTGRATVTLANAWGAPKDSYIATSLSADAFFSPDGSRIITIAKWETAVKLWDAKSGAAIATLSGHENPLVTAFFSDDSQRLVSFSTDDNFIRLWDGKTAALIARISIPRAPSGVYGFFWPYFNPDSSRLIITVPWENAIRLYNGRTGAQISTLSGHAGGDARASFSRDSTRILTVAADYKARMWDAKSGAALATLNIGYPTSQQYVVSIGARFSPDGSRILTTVPWERTATLWDGKTGRSLSTLAGHSAPIAEPSFSPDSTRLATAATDYQTKDVDLTVRLWDVQAGTSIATVSERSAFDPQGAKVKYGHASPFSPDSSRFLTWSGNVARLWDARTGNALSVFAGHTGEILDAEFSPDGRLVVTTSKDKTARLWNATINTATAGKS